MPSWDELLAAASQARAQAYAPYSRYAVGAALLAEDGALFSGCNVENVSFGLTVCAERNAVGAMVRAGHRRVEAVLVLTADGGTPCGACLQVLCEFAGPETPVRCVAESGHHREYRLGALIPHSFRTDSLASDVNQ